jgi:hypothetical protein
MTTINEERVVWSEVFYAETFDFRSRLNFCRYDECTFVRCTLLIDHATEQLAFTGCTFKVATLITSMPTRRATLFPGTIRSTGRWKKDVKNLMIT